MFVQKQTAKAARVLRPKEKTWVCNIKFWAWGLVFFFFLAGLRVGLCCWDVL